MKILYASSEAVPFIASGGLADVAGSLTKAIRHRQHACRVVLPLYGDIDEELRRSMKFVCSFSVALEWRVQYCGVLETTVAGVKYYFLDNEYYFKRRGIYGFFDDAERFAFFSMAVLEMLNHIDFAPEIIHCNDWQTALVPIYLNTLYRELPKFRDIKTVFTIHNIQYQGQYSMDIAGDVLGLPQEAWGIVHYEDGLNLMKGAIEQCDVLTTVSPTYAKEILDPWYSYGLDPLLRQHSHKLHGILNGIDTNSYNPETDTELFAPYSAARPQEKATNKRRLQAALGLTVDESVPIVSMITRLVSHKGLDLVQYVFHQMMQENIQFVLLGSGEWQYEKFFREMVAAYPNRVSVTLGFEPPLSRRIYAGSDLFLMPSKTEPCGLAQMIALRYGTLPIVRCTGGLGDSIVDVGDGGNGYRFLTYNAGDMLSAIKRGLADYAQTERWNGLVATAMRCDFGWGASANKYIELYSQLLSKN